MAGSRTEKLGTIFTRVRGLIRAKALTDENKPIWYDIYETFPPEVEPKFERRVPRVNIPDLLYPEDIIRAKFYSTYGNPDVVDLTNAHVKTTCQKLIEKYFELQKHKEVPEDELFQEAIDSLKEEGIRLRTLAEKEEDNKQRIEALAAERLLMEFAAKNDHAVTWKSRLSEDDETGGDFMIEEDPQVIDKKR